MRKRGWLLCIGSALVIGGAALLGSYFWTLHRAATVQQLAKQTLRRKATAPSRLRAPSRGDVVCELEIPRLEVSVAVFEGHDAGILRLGAGHIPQTALPSGSGNIGIAAHRDTYFRPLRLIRLNDVIELKTATVA